MMLGNVLWRILCKISIHVSDEFSLWWLFQHTGTIKQTSKSCFSISYDAKLEGCVWTREITTRTSDARVFYYELTCSSKYMN